jgi:choline dehydrogenase
MIHTDTFAKLFHLLDVLMARAGTQTKLSLGAAATIAALSVILRLFSAKQQKLITDYAKVARKVDGNGFEFDEWDFIIVGGGMKHHSPVEFLVISTLSRHSRMCSGIPSL